MLFFFHAKKMCSESFYVTIIILLLPSFIMAEFNLLKMKRNLLYIRN